MMDKSRCLPFCMVEMIKPTTAMKKAIFGTGES